ncbi:hypothetical protein AJ85_06415 [Alkalihalobacillus alcalophilus ATCC 27647 = CGMCC 1.3604]|uniref:Uncharacterized protein n=1 Tax=Alkalihalobacillus alcalophilus ATCC 27647 = CGMCC 1.3604 TaxID=1218173 RepID=A0A4S4K1V2_ALKAL|nr:hypothetical protein AJ85_06415 [Alkalihalobacillus alcalophilus ATCC 27647 = CGMCC 1.3604]
MFNEPKLNSVPVTTRILLGFVERVIDGNGTKLNLI